jgi:hypothetical protein
MSSSSPSSRSVANLALLFAFAASSSLACVSSNNNDKGSGGTAAGGDPAPAGGAGGTTTATVPTGGTTSTLPDCTLSSGIVTGNACPPNPKMLTIQDNTAGTGATGTACSLALWANDNTSGGYFFLPWCNSKNVTPTDCKLSMECKGGSIHVTGSYQSGTADVSGNGGFGLNLQTTFADAGPGCQMISGQGFTGLTIAINNTIIPSNQFIIGLTLANGNAGEYTATLTAGANTLNIPFSSFKNKNNCGSVPGPGIVNMYFVFPWFQEAAEHPVDATFGSLGFY